MTESKPSKSARKREQQELQSLGEQLISLGDAELASLALDERLCDAVKNARSMKAHGALRRQKQLIGKLMRDLDPEQIRSALVELRADDARDKQIFARAEKWRDRLIREGVGALDVFVAETGSPDPGLRSLLAELDVACTEKDEKTVRRKIFRRIHEILGKIR